MSETTIVKALVRDLYGEKLDALKEGESLEIADEDGVKVINYLVRRYKKERLFRSLRVGLVRKVFRVK